VDSYAVAGDLLDRTFECHHRSGDLLDRVDEPFKLPLAVTSIVSGVEPRLFAAQATTEAGFWMSTSEIFASHPHLSKRVGALLQSGHIVPADSSSYDHESGDDASLAPATITPA